VNTEFDPNDHVANPGQRNGFMILVLLIAGAAGVGAFFATGRMQPPPPAPENSQHRFNPEGRHMGPGPGAGRRDDDGARGLDEMHLRRFLNLDDEQVEKVRAADPEFRSDMAAVFEAMRAARGQFVEVLQNEDATDEQILARLDEVLALNARMERRVVDHLLRIRPHMDEDQSRRLMRLTAMHIRGAAFSRGRGPAPGDGPGLEGEGRRFGGPGGPGPGGRERFREFESGRQADQPQP
jgi:hypothetical protein